MQKHGIESRKQKTDQLTPTEEIVMHTSLSSSEPPQSTEALQPQMGPNSPWNYIKASIHDANFSHRKKKKCIKKINRREGRYRNEIETVHCNLHLFIFRHEFHLISTQIHLNPKQYTFARSIYISRYTERQKPLPQKWETNGDRIDQPCERVRIATKFGWIIDWVKTREWGWSTDCSEPE